MGEIRDLRIYKHHSLKFDRGAQVNINFEGARLKAFTREPVAVALFASGIPVTMRSFKYHRPRGMFCLNGRCSSCLMRVNGVPNIRTCKTRCQDQMMVQRQSALPDASNDLLFANDFIFPKSFDYHHMMTKPLWLNTLFKKAVRRFSGLGDLPDKPPDESTVIREMDCEVLVIGAGPAGIAASLAAASIGVSVILVDDHRRPGGHLLAYPEKIDSQFTGLGYSAERAALLIDKGVRFFSDNEVVGYYSEGFFASVKKGQLLKLKGKRTIIATGGYDQNFMFAQNDLPNIFSARGLANLTVKWGICPGMGIFILGSNDQALSLALRLPEIGVQVAGIAEPGPQIIGNRDWAEKIMDSGVPIFINYKPEKAIGRFHLKGIELVPTKGGEKVKTHCDLVASAAPLSPAFELASQAGVDVGFDIEKGGFIPVHDKYGRTNDESIFVAGEITGEMAVELARKKGRIAGMAAALDLRPRQKKARQTLKGLLETD